MSNKLILFSGGSSMKRKPKPLLIIIIILVILLIIIGGCFATWKYLSSPVDKNDNTEVQVVITSGMTSTKIGRILKSNQLIHNELLFRHQIGSF